MQHDLIRNVSIVGEGASGKSRLTNLLLMNDSNGSEGFNIAKECTEEEEMVKTQFYHLKRCNTSNDEEYSINLMDCPGCVEFSSDVNTSIGMSDGALMMASVDSGTLSLHSEMILRHAVQERVRLVLMLNKMDKVLMEMDNLENVYELLVRLIETVNVVICTYCDSVLENVQVYPILNTVAFGSALQGWSFTLQDFAKIYSKQFQLDESELVSKFWGDHYYDPESKEWLVDSMGGKLERGFCQFILKPIQNILRTCHDNNGQLEDVLSPFEISLSIEEKELKNNELCKCTMSKCLPASKCIYEMIINHLPSPKKAQNYRCENLYSGSLTDTFGNAIKNCDPEGPLMLHISKIILLNGKMYSIGRIYSGRIRNGMQVRVLGRSVNDSFLPKNVFEDKTIQDVVIIHGVGIESIEEASCGCIIGLVGIDRYISKSATITENSNLNVSTFKDLKQSNSSLINISIEPERQAHLPNLIKGMEKIAKCDPSLSFSLDEMTGEKILTVSSELHLKLALHEFKQIHSDIQFKLSEPVVHYRECITEKSSEILVKSPNKINRFFINAEPLQDDLVSEIERGQILFNNEDMKQRARILNEEFGWDLNDARKIWALNPSRTGPNLIVDQTRGVCNLNEIKDSTIVGFQYAVEAGPLCGEVIRGARFNLIDVIMVSDCIHRGAGQIIPTTKRGFHSSFMGASPTLAEPCYVVEFQCKNTDVGKIYVMLNQRRGIVIEEFAHRNSAMVVIKGYLPIIESFGLSEKLNSGGISTQFIYDHWQSLNGDVLDKYSRVGQLVSQIRQQKGMSENIPTQAYLSDRL